MNWETQSPKIHALKHRQANSSHGGKKETEQCLKSKSDTRHKARGLKQLKKPICDAISMERKESIELEQETCLGSKQAKKYRRDLHYWKLLAEPRNHEIFDQRPHKTYSDLKKVQNKPLEVQSETKCSLGHKIVNIHSSFSLENSIDLEVAESRSLEFDIENSHGYSKLEDLDESSSVKRQPVKQLSFIDEPQLTGLLKAVNNGQTSAKVAS